MIYIYKNNLIENNLTNLILDVCKDKTPTNTCNVLKRYGLCAKTTQFYEVMKKQCQYTCDLCDAEGNINFNYLSITNFDDDRLIVRSKIDYSRDR